jgi:hypothetical protein
MILQFIKDWGVVVDVFKSYGNLREGASNRSKFENFISSEKKLRTLHVNYC